MTVKDRAQFATGNKVKELIYPKFAEKSKSLLI